MKTTPFTPFHLALGAKMHEFAGYNMPIEYNGILNEHLCVVDRVGVFDVSHMGEIWVKGPQALPFLQQITTNDVSTLEIGKAQYSCFTNDNGGIVDDLLVYKYEAEKYLLVVNASNTDKDWQWCLAHNNCGAILENSSDAMAQLAIQGPLALATLQKLTTVPLDTIPYYHFVTGEMAGVKEVIISNTGYTGAGGFELYFNNNDGVTLWNAIFEAGKEYGIQPIGLGARDTLRLEMGFSLYGNDLNDETTPLEAGLGWITKFKEGKEFTGKSILAQQKAAGVKQKLTPFILTERGIPRHGYEIVDKCGNKIGTVTSGTISPITKEGIGMGYIATAESIIGHTIYIKIRNTAIPAKIVKLPFRKK